MGSNGSAPGAEVSGRILRVRHPQMDLTGPFGCHGWMGETGCHEGNALEGLSKQPPNGGCQMHVFVVFFVFELMPNGPVFSHLLVLKPLRCS